MRLLSGLFLLLGLGAFALDILDAGNQFVFRPLGEAWFKIDRESYLLLQPAIERHIHPDLWFSVVEPMMRTPGVYLFLGGAALFWLLSWLFRRRAA